MSLLEATRVVDRDGTVVLCPAGEVDPWTASQLRDDALGVIASNKPIAVDLRAVTYMDRDAVRALVDISRCLVGASRPRLELRNVPRPLMKRLTDDGTASSFRVEGILRG